MLDRVTRSRAHDSRGRLRLRNTTNPVRRAGVADARTTPCAHDWPVLTRRGSGGTSLLDRVDTRDADDAPRAGTGVAVDHPAAAVALVASGATVVPSLFSAPDDGTAVGNRSVRRADHGVPLDPRINRRYIRWPVDHPHGLAARGYRRPHPQPPTRMSRISALGGSQVSSRTDVTEGGAYASTMMGSDAMMRTYPAVLASGLRWGMADRFDEHWLPRETSRTVARTVGTDISRHGCRHRRACPGRCAVHPVAVADGQERRPPGTPSPRGGELDGLVAQQRELRNSTSMSSDPVWR